MESLEWYLGTGRKTLGGALEDELALVFGEERLNPCYEVGGDPPFGEEASHLVGTAIVQTTFDVQEKS